MTDTITVNKGWFGICPVYVYKPDSEAPLIVARHWSLELLFDISEAFMGACIAVLQWSNPDYEPAWAIRVGPEVSIPSCRVGM